MVKKRYKIVWTKRSQQHLAAAYEYISKDSEKSARKVVNAIVNAMDRTIENPDYYALDKYKIDNDGSYRYFEKHHYRVAYRFTGSVIRVLRVRHTKMNPQKY
ncbi:MAG: type II toxin-antitoxin system RelE/ParE family toxin [Agriterribacter sp.]